MIDNPEVVAQIAALHDQYEAALVSNDVEKLVTFFWDSPRALRFGVAESLYGARAIDEFRRNRPPIDLARQVSNLTIVAFGNDCAIVTLEFDRTFQGSPRHGRQSQVWRKFDESWKIVSAHVSVVPPSYVELAGPLIGLPIPPQNRDGVRQNVERAAAIARPLMEMTFSDAIEAAPAFTP